MSPVLFPAPDGREWQMSLRPPRGLNGPANVPAEDLVFESNGEELVLKGIGFILGKPLANLSQAEREDLFAQAEKVQWQGKRRGKGK